MGKFKTVGKEFLIITLGTLIAAVGVYFFLMPSSLSVGSISGLAIIIGNFVPLPISTITMILNVGLLIIGFIFVGKDFGGKTVYTSILLPVFLGMLEKMFPNFQSLSGDPFVDMILYVFTVSIGLAMLFNANASSGGLDIVAKLLNKFLKMELGTAMALPGMVVAVSAIFVSDIYLVVLSVLGTYINGIIIDHFIFGFSVKKRVCILSKKDKEIRDYIVNELHSGATFYEAIGAYDYQKKTEIITIVDKSEYTKLMNFIEKTDGDAFVTVYTVNNIIYKPKKVNK